MRPLAVSGRTRARELPDVPTVRESGFGDYDVSTSYALFAPAGTPQPILGRLQAEVKRALKPKASIRGCGSPGSSPASVRPKRSDAC